MKTFVSIIYQPLAIILLISFVSVQCGKEKTTGINDKTDVIFESEYAISPDINKTSTVSNKLLGFNLIYPYESNTIWQDGKIAGYLKDMNVGFLRYPGGTVCSYYHWNALTGEGWKDSWDPINTVPQHSPSEFMDIDEYMALVKTSGATPLVGVNMSSGWRWNRTNDGIAEAIALMQYCKDKNFQVDYWFLDNEPYQPDGNGGAKTPDQYAALVNTYATAMKAFNPNIKIVINWTAGFKNKRSDYNKLIQIAGTNIDVIDVHWYWAFSDASWEKWLAKTPMEQWTGDTYAEDIAYFRQMVKDLGYPNIKLASFEWNVGPTAGSNLTPSRVAFTQAEMMMQFISGGLDIAVLWPIHWPDVSNKVRSLYNETTNTVNPDYQLFKYFGQMKGGKLFDTQIIKAGTAMVSIAVQDADLNTLRICVLNKNTKDMVTDIQMDKFPDMHFKDAQMYTTNLDGTVYTIAKADTLKSGNSKVIKFKSKSISLTMLTFGK